MFATGEPFRSDDPATAATVATLASSTPADVDRAVAAAERAFRTSRWATTASCARAFCTGSRRRCAPTSTASRSC